MTPPHASTTAKPDDGALQLEHDLVEILREERGLADPAAFELAADLVRGIRKRWGGMRLGTRGLYIPAPSKTERNEAIRRAYDGTNGPRVMREHGISRSSLFRIVNDGRPRRTGIGVSSPKDPAPSRASASDER
ncbi:hypothetical protein QTH87_05935 [Variovorax sp. J22P168]|nr:hypothetical protein [Variovorax sp. J22P168]